MKKNQLDGWEEVEHWMNDQCFKCKKCDLEREDGCKIAMKLLYSIDLTKEEAKCFFDGGPITSETQCKEFEGDLNE